MTLLQGRDVFTEITERYCFTYAHACVGCSPALSSLGVCLAWRLCTEPPRICAKRNCIVNAIEGGLVEECSISYQKYSILPAIKRG